MIDVVCDAFNIIKSFVQLIDIDFMIGIPIGICITGIMVSGVIISALNSIENRSMKERKKEDGRTK